jgi:hypothetical protein
LKKIISAEGAISLKKVCLASSQSILIYISIYNISIYKIMLPLLGIIYVHIPTGCPGRATGATTISPKSYELIKKAGSLVDVLFL